MYYILVGKEEGDESFDDRVVVSAGMLPSILIIILITSVAEGLVSLTLSLLTSLAWVRSWEMLR